MPSLTAIDLGSRTVAKPKRWKTKAEMAKVGGEKGKLHREMGVPEGEKIPKDKLRAATHSKDPEKRRDAVRAETMSKWRRVHNNPRSH